MRVFLAAVVAVMLSCLAIPPAQASESSWCTADGSEGNGTINVFLVSAGGGQCGVLRMMAQLAGVPGLPSQTGFFRLYGPRGPLGDSETKYWTSSESYRVDVNQKSFDGALWCAEFWMRTGSTFTRAGDALCFES